MNKLLARGATVLMLSSPFSLVHTGCRPPRTPVLEEGAMNMGKPQIVTKVEEDAKTPKERLDSGDTGVVPKKREGDKLPGHVDLPQKPVRIPPKSL